MKGDRLFKGTGAKAEITSSTLVSDHLPKADQLVTTFCLDKYGPYKLPFPCFHDGETWVNATTNEDIVVEVYAWTPLDDMAP